jgi:hypothetical protein
MSFSGRDACLGRYGATFALFQGYVKFYTEVCLAFDGKLPHIKVAKEWWLP